jgi:hypothetical protein
VNKSELTQINLEKLIDHVTSGALDVYFVYAGMNVEQSTAQDVSSGPHYTYEAAKASFDAFEYCSWATIQLATRIGTSVPVLQRGLAGDTPDKSAANSWHDKRIEAFMDEAGILYDGGYQWTGKRCDIASHTQSTTDMLDRLCAIGPKYKLINVTSHPATVSGGQMTFHVSFEVEFAICLF